MTKFRSDFRSAWKIFEGLEVAGFLPYDIVSPVALRIKPYGKVREELGAKCFSPLPDDLPFYVDHDASQVLSNGRDGRGTYYDDAEGVFFRLQLPNNRLGRKIYELASKDQLGVSCGMKVFRDFLDEETWLAEPVRYVQRAKLEEISLVQNPVYSQSCVRAENQRNYQRKAEKLTQLIDGVLTWTEPEVKFQLI
jgi:HK97 family phage prohead protease